LKAGRVIRPEAKVWRSKYLNNIIEQDHRRVKQRIYPMLGFKRFRSAAIAITGIELAQMIRKGQFDTSGVIVRGGARVPHVWEAVLAA
jgi:transposase-like protein